LFPAPSSERGSAAAADELNDAKTASATIAILGIGSPPDRWGCHSTPAMQFRRAPGSRCLQPDRFEYRGRACELRQNFVN
jgi:hypothetical protein